MDDEEELDWLLEQEPVHVDPECVGHLLDVPPSSSSSSSFSFSSSATTGTTAARVGSERGGRTFGGAALVRLAGRAHR